MWLNYFLTTVRSLRKNTFYVLANLISLGVAFALMIIGYFNYEFNHSFNRFFPDADRIYKINSARDGITGQRSMGISPLALGTYMAEELGEERVSRIHYSSAIIRNDDELVRKRLAYIDPSFLQMFPFPDIEGQITRLDNRSGIIITEDLALSLFDRVDVVGEEVNFHDEMIGKRIYRIDAVVDDFPRNISFRFDILMQFDEYLDHSDIERNSWSEWVDATFVSSASEANDRSEIVELANAYLDIQNEQNPTRKVINYELDSVLSWPQIENELYQSRFVGVLHPASVLGTISSAVFILLLACFNFINISISLSGRRLREIAMRKVLGGTKNSIVIQFMIENIVMVLISIVLAIAIAFWLIPSYNALFEYNIVQFRFLNWTPFILFSVVIFCLVILIAGGYPAFYISRFPSLMIFRQKAQVGGSGKLLSVLVALQFVICFYNVFSLMVFVENASYQETLDRGYDVRQVLNIPVADETQYNLLKAELGDHEQITNFGGTKHLIGFHSVPKKIQIRGEELELATLKVGEGYLETMKVRLIKGRELRNGDEERAVVLVNELMENILGGDAVGQNIRLGEQVVKVVGVVEDFNLRTILLDNDIKPAVISSGGMESVKYLSLRGRFDEDREMLLLAEQKWYELFPDELFEGFWQENVIRPLRQTNNIIININGFVAVMAILISVLGLYATVSLAIGRRIKELGIRKVLGATFWQITYVLNSRLFLILTVSSVLGLIGGYLFISDLLDIIYAYHINIGLRHFVVPVLLILMIVLASIGWKVGNAVKENPVKQLRTE